MAGKRWQAHEGAKFCRELKIGRPYYYENEHATNLGPYEDQYTYSEVVFVTTAWFPTGRKPVTAYGNSASSILYSNGPMYENVKDLPHKPRRNLADPEPQVAGPLPDDYKGILDEDEIRGLEKRNLENIREQKRAGRKRWL
jgi:hypothetical protein